MKFNIEVELDWIDRESIDDEVKKQIIDGIVAQLSEGLLNDLTDNAMKRVNAKLDELVLELFNGFMDKGVTITNNWGEIVKENVKIEDLMKERLDKALHEKVNNNGITSEYGNTTRLKYMMDKRINSAVEKMTKEVIAQVDAKISDRINEEIKQRLSASLLSKIDVDGIVKNTVEKLTR